MLERQESEERGSLDPELLMNEKKLPKRELFFALSKHRANRILHKFTFSTWLQQILTLGDSSQLQEKGSARKFPRPWGAEAA